MLDIVFVAIVGVVLYFLRNLDEITIKFKDHDPPKFEKPINPRKRLPK